MRSTEHPHATQRHTRRALTAARRLPEVTVCDGGVHEPPERLPPLSMLSRTMISLARLTAPGLGRRSRASLLLMGRNEYLHL